jgi:transcriptional regulator with XRE-family HTH domain
MAHKAQPVGWSEFAVALRALRERAGNPSQQEIGRAIGKTHSLVGYVLRGQHMPPWETAAALVRALGGRPADFRTAWEAAREAADGRGPAIVPGLRELRARNERLDADIRDWLGRVTPELLMPGLPPGWLAGYRISGAGGRDVSVWHKAGGCRQSGVVHDVGAAVDWALDHEQEVHGGGS